VVVGSGEVVLALSRMDPVHPAGGAMPFNTASRLGPALTRAVYLT